MQQTKVLTHVTHLNGWNQLYVYKSYMSQNFRLLHVSNVFVLNFRSDVSGTSDGRRTLSAAPATRRGRITARRKSEHRETVPAARHRAAASLPKRAFADFRAYRGVSGKSTYTRGRVGRVNIRHSALQSYNACRARRMLSGQI